MTGAATRSSSSTSSRPPSTACPPTFGGQAIRGDGTDEDVLRRAGADGADVFLALTEGDNRNIMAAQLANEALGIERVIAKVNDPVRAKAYAELGIATLCRTGLMMDSVDSLSRPAAERVAGDARPDRPPPRRPRHATSRVPPRPPPGQQP